MPETGVVVEGLVKRFGSFVALHGVDFVVPEGRLVGLLGPNGAGKTTVIRILSTLLQPDGGRASVAGYDVVAQPQQVRAAIGLTGQFAAVDEDLTGRENLVLVGRLSRMTKVDAETRAAELLDVFDLTDAADRVVRGYSGGMRRRLDLGASFIASPDVLFLDEPTTGLDPRSRLRLWDVITDRRDAGKTIVLTTQYMEEADHLAERISVIDGGGIIAEGTADQLKDKVGGDVLDLAVADRGAVAAAASALARAFGVPQGELTTDDELGTVQVPVQSGASALVEAVRALDAAGVAVADMGLRRPSLDDVFLSLTGHLAEEARPDAPEPRLGRGRRRV
ncbi:MAG TPA: ATP-binding cassette domain-containing protein [Acidimicrobiia bacterium]|jgi:ABC-2 type transport system ATP-binding protein